jgi:hypothetical protein
MTHEEAVAELSVIKAQRAFPRATTFNDKVSDEEQNFHDLVNLELELAATQDRDNE